ncbi:RagB/SusD family nutrient uptake outer membrane protein [Empedobacter brevis]|uniref:RagB/SusD family nutrient uptake outer membrane protein n=1 Tax=Empedobacter brevis TaxID=247 RepID=UPI0039B08C31
MKKIIILLFVVSYSSCEKFIDLDLPKDQITQETVFKDGRLAQSALAGLYQSLRENGFLSGGFLGGGVYFGCYTDELVSYQTANSSVDQFYQLNLNPTSSAVKELWQTTYNQIYKANRIIEGLENSNTIELSTKNQLKGEALFIRGLLHLYLVQSYGEIPYITTSDYKVTQHVSKNTIEEVYQKIEEDVLLAQQLLALNTPVGNRFIPSKEATELVLSRLYLLQKRWDDAIKVTTNLAQNDSYKLRQDISKTYLKDNSSTIWQYAPASASATTLEASIYLMFFAPPYIVALQPSFVDSFQTGDLRFQNWIGTIADFTGKKYYYASKYKQYSTADGQNEYSIILRNEETILNRAEAYIQKGDLANGVMYLNKIVTRAGLTAVTMGTKEQLLERVLEERQHELFTEYGARFFDLKRLNQLNAKMIALKPKWKSTFELFPLPESELLLNPNLNPQNDGY